MQSTQKETKAFPRASTSVDEVEIDVNRPQLGHSSS